MNDTWVVIATGESLKPDPAAVVERVRHLPCVVVNDAYVIAPWARVLMAADPNWWLAHPAAKRFAGEKWCNNAALGVPRLPASPWMWTNTNSGLCGLHYAATLRHARRVLLLGIDMVGSHYYGDHPRGLENTEPKRFAKFIQQFEDYAANMIRPGVQVINCSAISALTCFPKMALDDALDLIDEKATA